LPSVLSCLKARNSMIFTKTIEYVKVLVDRCDAVTYDRANCDKSSKSKGGERHGGGRGGGGLVQAFTAAASRQESAGALVLAAGEPQGRSGGRKPRDGRRGARGPHRGGGRRQLRGEARGNFRAAGPQRGGQDDHHSHAGDAARALGGTRLYLRLRR